MEYIRTQLSSFFEEEEVFYDADEYFGPSPEGERAPVEPRNSDLYWVSHPNGPQGESPVEPELEFSREDATRGLLDCLIQEERTPKENPENELAAAVETAVASTSDDSSAENLRSSIAKLSTLLETGLALASSAPPEPPETSEPVAPASPPPPPSLFANVRYLLASVSVPKLKLPSLKLPVVKLPSLKLRISTPRRQPAPATTVKKEPEPLHYARTPLATFARVKSRLQDRPPLVAAFADQVAVLSPSSLVPLPAFEGEVPVAQRSRNLRLSVLLGNLRDLLPTPVGALLSSKGPRKRSLVSILGGRAAKKVVAEIEHDPLDDSMIPQYQKWKKIKNEHVHNAQWSFLITACILLICAIHIEKLREIKWWKFEFWQWLALGFVALAGRLVSGWCVKLMVILIEYNFLLKKRILYFIFGLRHPVKNSLWLGFILLTWTLVVQHTPDVSDTIPTVTKLLMCAFTASTLWVIKVLLVKILANTFHRTAYFDRIQDSLFHQYVLEVLSEPRSHRRAHGRGVGGKRRAAPVLKLSVPPSTKKVTARDAKKQGRIERQYSPIFSKFRPRKDKRLEPRPPAWAKYKDADNDSVFAIWASKLPSISPFALAASSIAGSSPRSPRFRPRSPAGTESSRREVPAEGLPSSLKGGAGVQAAGDSDGGSSSQTKGTLPEVGEKPTLAQVVVESAPLVVAVLLDLEDEGPMRVAEEATTQRAAEVVATGPQAQALLQQSDKDAPANLKPGEPLGLALGASLAASEAAPNVAAAAAPQAELPAAVVAPAVVVAAVAASPGLTPAEEAPPFVEPDIEMEEGELEDEAGHEQQTTLAQDKIQVLTKDSVSAWTLMRLMKVVRTRNLRMYSKASLLEPDWEIDSIPMATAAAEHIFKNVAGPGQQELVLKNFMKLFPPNKATQAFSTFEVTVDGTITKQGLLKWVLDVYKERKSLSLTLNDNRMVIYQINLLLDGVLLSVIVAISFLIMSFNNQALLVCTTMLLSPAVSIFGNLLRNTFESILFLFIVHPFDVGDRVSVEGVPLMVEEMRIMSTMFLNNSSEHITYPNFILINKPIANIHRSPDQWDAIEFQILAHTALEKLSMLRTRIEKYVVGLPQIWYPRWRLLVKDIEDTNRLTLVMTIQHHINFQDAGERTQRRSDMLVHIQAVMNELKIGYELPQGQAVVTKWPLGFP